MEWLIGLGVLVLVIAWAISVYNYLIRYRNQVKNAWSQIDVQLQRRYDLIPNMIETVKGYMGYEKGTLESVIQARNQAMAAREKVNQSGGPTNVSLQELLKAETVLRGTMTQFFALAENYPQLKASETMMRLQEELSSTENKVAYARQAYNDQVLYYNNAQQQFPGVLFAGIFGHHPADLYQIEDESARQSVKVSF